MQIVGFPMRRLIFYFECKQSCLLILHGDTFNFIFFLCVFSKTIKWLKRCYRRTILKETKEEKAAMPGWEKDYQLEATGNTSLYHEYLEMGR